MIILGINKSNIVRTNYNKKIYNNALYYYIFFIIINNFVHNNEKENINKN